MNNRDRAEQVAAQLRDSYQCEATVQEWRAWGEPEPLFVVVARPHGEVLLPAMLDGIVIWSAL